MSVAADHPVLLFDGVCNVCNGAVNFVIDRDPEGIFRFASLQSETGKQLLAEHELTELRLSTMVLIHDSKAYLHSDSVLNTACLLGRPWSWLQPLRAIPRMVRDPIYRLLARHRYRWFGRADQCRVPTPELRERFL